MTESVKYQSIGNEEIEKGLKLVREFAFKLGFEQGFKEGYEQGRGIAIKAVLLRRGSRKFGPPNQHRIDSLNDVTLLEQITDRLLDGLAAGWDDLLSSLSPNP